jgi:fumarate hydratase class II
MMQVIIGSLSAFTDKCVVGIQANETQAEGWLERNAIVVTALNPLIGYQAGADLVKISLSRDVKIRDLAIEKARAGELAHVYENRPVTAEEVEAALGDLRKLTEGGIIK